MEDIRKKCSIVNFKVKTSFIGQSHDLLENKPDIFDEERIDKGIYNFTMLVSRMFIEYDVILNKEVRNIEIQVYCLRYCVQTNDFSSTVHCKAGVLR